MCSEVPLTAKLWGCQEAAVFSAAQEWAENWADARALLTLAYQLNLRIVILNQKEGCVETITTEGPQAGAAQTIVLRFTGDHYDTVQEPPLRDLEAIRTSTPLTPWTFRTSDLRGGFTRVQRLTGPFRRLDLLRSRKKLRREIPKGRTGTSEDLQPGMAPDAQTSNDHLTGPIITWNVGGWRARKYDILELLQAYSPLILALQEVRVAQDHRKGFSHFFAQVGYHVSFAQCAGWVPNKGGHMRIDQQIPCVVCLSRKELSVHGQPIITQAAQEEYKRGRLQILRWERDEGAMLLYNIYSYAGTHREHCRANFREALEREIAQQATDCALVLGDWNEDPLTNPTILMLTTTRGWKLPPLTSASGQPQLGTYGGRDGSWLDAMVVGRDLPCPQATQVPIMTCPTQHAPVMMGGWTARDISEPRLIFPPRPMAKKDAPTYTWDQLQSLEIALEESTPGTSQETIDTLWDSWSNSVQEFVFRTCRLLRGAP